MADSVPLLTDRFAALAPAYEVVLSDVWGVVHNGIEATPSACQALVRFREGGGTVVLISNAPRPGATVIRMLDRLGVPPAAYDGIVTSGDVTRGLVTARGGDPLYHLGPERDRGIFRDLDIRFVDVEAAAYVVCTGLFDDDRETPDDYVGLLTRLRERRLSMICANPDLVVERGHQLVYCAGAIADAYAERGGEVVYAGKPHRPIYEEALARAAAARGTPSPLCKVLAIGDSLRTDVSGAAKLGVDCLFLTAGIHAEELGHRDEPDLNMLGRMFAEARLAPRAVMRALAW